MRIHQATSQSRYLGSTCKMGKILGTCTRQTEAGKDCDCRSGCRGICCTRGISSRNPLYRGGRAACWGISMGCRRGSVPCGEPPSSGGIWRGIYPCPDWPPASVACITNFEFFTRFLRRTKVFGHEWCHVVLAEWRALQSWHVRIWPKCAL